MNQQNMTYMERLEVLETKTPEREGISFCRKAEGESRFNELDLIAAEALCDMANAWKSELKLGKRKCEENGSFGRSGARIRQCSVNKSSVTDDYDDLGSSYKAVTDDVSVHKHWLSASEESKNSAEFSFSIIHLLSAVRAALLTTLQVDEVLANRKPVYCINWSEKERTSICSKECFLENLPGLTLDQITGLVQSRPGDYRILECKEPLVELVKGSLDIFVSETLLVGVTSWKPLAMYDRSSKTWSWTGPVILYGLGIEKSCPNKLETSSSAWGLSQENLLELVARYAIWLKREQVILQHTARLPSFPLKLVQENNFHARFSIRRKLNPSTITASCEELRAYFQREEAIRYLIPERAFQYTNLDGKKSTVAPLRMGKNSRKTLTKARGHYIFKPNRPPQFSLLSLVRDAAARLPDGMGTRADICILIRDSQYLVESILEKTVKQVVSGALDRLQSESDPCVKYNGKWGVWEYLHRNREEEDFVGITGTSSTKISKTFYQDVLDSNGAPARLSDYV